MALLKASVPKKFGKPWKYEYEEIFFLLVKLRAVGSLNALQNNYSGNGHQNT